MAIVCTFATRIGAVAFFSIHRTLMGLPRVGLHIGGGIHVDMPGTAPALTDPPLGWTVRYRRMRRRLLDSVYGWVVDGSFTAAAADPTARARLTGTQRAILDNAIAAAADDPAFDDPALFDESDELAS